MRNSLNEYRIIVVRGFLKFFHKLFFSYFLMDLNFHFA